MPDAPAEDAPIFLDAPARAAKGRPSPAHQPEPVPEFSIEDTSADDAAVSETKPAEAAAAEKGASPWPKIAPPGDEISVEAPAQAEFAVVDESSATESQPAAASPSEIDLSSEWNDAITVETDDVAVEAAAAEIGSASAGDAVPESDKTDATVDEIRFYISQRMLPQAMAALAKLQTLTSDQAKLDELRAEVEAAAQPSEEETAAVAEPEFEELTAEDIPTLEVELEELPVDKAPVAVAPATEEPITATPAVTAPAVAKEIPVAAKLPVEAQPAAVAHASEPAHQLEPQTGALKEFVSELETSIGDGRVPETEGAPAAAASAAILPAPVPAPAPPAAAPAARVEPAVAATQLAPVLGEFVADIEASLGEDFLSGAPVVQPEAAAPVAKAPTRPLPPAPVSSAAAASPVVPAAVAAPPVIPPMAASAAAAASTPHQAAPQSAPTMAAPAAAASASVAWQAPVVPAPRPQPSAPSISHAPVGHAPAAKASPFSDDAGVDLAEMFGELKQDLEADVASTDEDPETHYNLGIAFREMGLLDEAIGELQKACQSFDHGKPFLQIMQAYTWLAQCFLEKGVPEAAVRWYEKALKRPGIDGETRVALHYELASAYETAGDKPSALHHFMDVYGSNIDYRDVAERIKGLKS